ncbi:MAG: glycoside hydrolase [Firmicutes bacterium]|nr:glycoside hydrolase [Bacillota bacterium]MCM1401034.1 glycoside hydrolase [Bacteroides sp.]MCM1476953.1 glycoside hydrolase [Bacteroides sp.]
MKKLVVIIFVTLVVVGAFLNMGAMIQSDSGNATPASTDSLFEVAVGIIKKYETMHQPRHWPLVGYGHLVLPGEKFSRTKAMNEADADALLRKDLLKNCAVFRNWGADSLILGVLAYNIGSGATKKSSVAKKLAAGDRDIYNNYISHCKYRGKPHKGIRQRRIEEFNALFLTDSVLNASSPVVAANVN